VVVPFGTRGGNRGIGIFGSVTVAPDSNVQQLPLFFTAGVSARGVFDARLRDAVGFSIAGGYFSNELQRAQRDGLLVGPNGGIQDRETVMELTYRFDFHKSALFVQPDVISNTFSSPAERAVSRSRRLLAPSSASTLEATSFFARPDPSATQSAERRRRNSAERVAADQSHARLRPAVSPSAPSWASTALAACCTAAPARSWMSPQCLTLIRSRAIGCR